MNSGKDVKVSDSEPALQPKRGRGRPSKAQASGEELRELIVAAATRDYAKNGYQGTSVSHILTAAGISRPTFYRYFKNRREVLDIAIGRLNDLLLEFVIEITQDKDTVQEFVTAAVDAYFMWGSRIGSVAGTIYREINDPRSPASDHRERVLGELSSLLQKQMEALGKVPPDPLLAEALLQVVEHIGHAAFWPELQPPREIARRRAVISHILVASLASP